MATIKEITDALGDMENRINDKIVNIENRIGDIEGKVVNIETNSKTVANNSKNLMKTVDEVKNDFSFSNILDDIGLPDDITDKIDDIPKFIEEHIVFFLVLAGIVILGIFSTLVTFIITILNFGFLCIVLDKVNKIDLLILQKK